MNERLLILDSNAILYRAFHALPLLTTTQGQPTNAVYGFLLLFFKLEREFKPNYLCACFDFPAKTFRHKKFKDYKAKRPPTPKDLVSQIPILKEILKAFQILILEKEGYEADDIIGTLIEKTPENLEKIIVTGDIDIFQLIRENVKVYFLSRGVKEGFLFDPQKVKEKFFGLNPWQIPDFKALVGDASDNIPGIKGIGPKTAASLLLKYQNISHLLENLPKENEISFSQKQEILKKKEKILENLEILKIDSNVPISFSLDQMKRKNYNEEKIKELFEKLEFKSLLKKFSQKKEERKENLQLL